MKYLSTRGGTPPLSFSDAVMTGMAEDGGLLLPSSIPDVSRCLPEWRRLGYVELAVEILARFSDLPREVIHGMAERSYSTFRDPDVAPVVTAGPFHILELFHGPTLAFKDIAMQYLGHLFEYTLSRKHQSMNILAATSGDTGSAAIHGFRGRDRIRVFVLHPRGKVSPTQERQMTTVLDDNVFNLAVEGTFDDCQSIVKGLFSDLEFKRRHALGAVNSINWARVLAQMVYYFHAAFRVMDRTGTESVRFCVPSGNFGNILAGYLAVRMGLPVDRLVLAANRNDVLARFFTTGKYESRPAVSTPSPSMDIQVASNFERYLYYRMEEDPAAVKAAADALAGKGALSVGLLPDGRVDSLIAAGAADNETTLKTIRDTYARDGYLVDPHTAVGLAVARHHLSDRSPMICLSTAHPAKFSEAITQAVGDGSVAQHPIIERLAGLASRCDVVPASVSAVREYIAERT